MITLHYFNMFTINTSETNQSLIRVCQPYFKLDRSKKGACYDQSDPAKCRGNLLRQFKNMLNRIYPINPSFKWSLCGLISPSERPYVASDRSSQSPM